MLCFSRLEIRYCCWRLLYELGIVPVSYRKWGVMNPNLPCAAMAALLLLLFLLAFSRPHRGSRIKFKEQSCLSSLLLLLLQLFVLFWGLYCDAAKSELVQRGYGNTIHFLFRLLSLYLEIPQCSKRRVFLMLCGRSFFHSFSVLNCCPWED